MIKIGCCGFAKGKKEYFKHFKLVEIQQTFYRILPENTLKRWRQEAPDDFEFSVKAFQGITHPVTSPTWRRSGLKLKGDERYGNLQPSKEVMESWEITRRVCDILKARLRVEYIGVHPPHPLYDILRILQQKPLRVRISG